MGLPCGSVAVLLGLSLLLLPKGEGQFNYSRYQHDTWTKISRAENIFTARNGHATCQFQNKIWLFGGRTSEYETWNLQPTERNADVWYTEDGVVWTKQDQLQGHFEVQNYDVKVPGPIAPWYARFGHTVDPMDITGDGYEDIMLLAGGYTPQPANDVWITQDGVTWEFVDYSPWSGRAWHASAVYNGSIFILGGTPLNNEVWEGRVFKDDSLPYRVWYGRAYLNTRWHIRWKNWAEVMAVPWAPRAGHKAAVQCKYSVGLNKTEHIDDRVKRINYEWPQTFRPKCLLYVIGGYGGYNESSFYYTGLRSMNDVWVTDNGVNWTVATYAAPWSPRAFHDVVVWHDTRNITQDVTEAGRNSSPRIWMAGGGYMGMKDNNIVYIMKGYIDLWWTRNGADWFRVDWEQGEGSYLFTTNTWAKTTVSGTRIYLGKWGHQLQRFVSPDSGDYMYFIGGTHVGDGDMVQDVWKSINYVFCDLNGITCSGEESGYCGPGLRGCICMGLQYGEYCEKTRLLQSAASHSVSSILRVAIVAVLVTAIMMI